MDDYTLDETNRGAAPDWLSTSDESLSSSDSSSLLLRPDEDVNQWIDRLLAPPPSEPAIHPLPGSFPEFDYGLPFDPQSFSLDDLLAFPPPPDPRLFAIPFHGLHSPSLDSQSGSSAAAASPASVGSSLPSGFAASPSPTSWLAPTAFSPPLTATPTSSPAPSLPTILDTLATDSAAANLGLDLASLRAKLDPSYHAALHAAINVIATAAELEKPCKEALFPLLREVDGKEKKDRRWFCRFRDCRWANAGYNRCDRAVAHLLKDHFGTRFECKEAGCGREFKWRHDLLAHARRDHAADGIAPTRVLCQDCGRDFSKKSNLDRHTREGICPSLGGGPGKVKSKAPRPRRSKAATIRAKPDEYDNGDYQVVHSNHRQVC